MPRLEEYSAADIAAFRQKGIDGAMNMLLSMPNSPGNIVPAAGTWTRDTANAMMRHYMKRTNVDASTLSVVHVAGTKGKGSTCAFTESILRTHGAKTGLFTSPHLIVPNERFRINGTPVSDGLFVNTFWAIWDALVASESDLGPYPRIPNYFTALTLMALRLFVQEHVDVAILEVGLGGRLDATNVIDKPVVCGITALDYDHTRILGNTLGKIAREKAGIIKAGVPAYTIPQAPEAAEVLAACAAAEPSTLVVVPPFNTTDELAVDVKSLNMHGQYQLINASLAVALASTWLAAKAGTPTPPLRDAMTPTVLKGLQAAVWPGRAQSVVDPVSRATFYLDGAHTPLSVACCVAWFESCCDDPRRRTTLVFNCHHERDVVALFQPLLATRFDNVVICATGSGRPSICRIPTVEDALKNTSIDLPDLHLRPAAMSPPVDADLMWQHVCATIWAALTASRGQDSTPVVLPTMKHTLEWIRENCAVGERVLVTGSLYTVGDALQALGWQEQRDEGN